MRHPVDVEYQERDSVWYVVPQCVVYDYSENCWYTCSEDDPESFLTEIEAVSAATEWNRLCTHLVYSKCQGASMYAESDFGVCSECKGRGELEKTIPGV